MKIELFDTTLRDGAQARNVSFSLKDKLKVVDLLDNLGISYIEAGNPGSNPKDVAFFEELSKKELKNASIVAFGSTRFKGKTCEEDVLLNVLADTFVDYVCIFGKSWDFHATEIIKVSLEENLLMIKESIEYLIKKGKEVFFDAEHFYDGFKSNKEYALTVLQTAKDAGATRLVLCDTNGGCFPEEVYEITKEVTDLFGDCVGIHAHNDTGLAVANSHAAVNAGAVQVQGVLTGFGERCGNTNLSTVMANLQLKKGVEVITNKQLETLTETSFKINELANLKLDNGMPYVGKNAFAHKGGMHIDGVLKNSRTFEHTSPDSIGNTRDFLISEVAGKSAILKQVRKINPSLEKGSEETAKVMAAIKEHETLGYQYELADASLELLVNKVLGTFNPNFELLYYEVRDISTNGLQVLATIKANINGSVRLVSEEGFGPVHALDKCLRDILEEFYPQLKELKLEDYKVRVLDSDEKTDASVRVVITSTDGKKSWKTIGVNHNIIKASLDALIDSLEYKLLD